MSYTLDQTQRLIDIIQNLTPYSGSNLTSAESELSTAMRYYLNQGLESSENDNVIDIFEASDFPDAINNVIILEDSKIYQIHGNVNILDNKLQVGVNCTLRGRSPALDFIESTTTDALINSNTNFRVFEMGFKASNGSIFDIQGTGVEICLMFGVRFFGTGELGTVADYDLFEIQTGLFAGYSAGLTFSGSFVSCLMLDCSYIDVNGITTIDFNGATFDSVKIANCDFTVPDGGNALGVDVDGANINEGGIGIVTGTSFNLSGSGASAIGYSPLDLKWSISSENSNIIPSDRIQPAGWGYYQDGETSPATLSLTTSDSILQIDGAGANSSTDYLPRAIRGSGDLWSSNKITPISIGDSYDLRLDLEITAKGGGATALNAKLDIGGGATPSIVIVDRQSSISKSVPFTISIGLPIFCLSTFKTNGGQFFLSTDTGTATVATRAITLSRNSSGAS